MTTRRATEPSILFKYARYSEVNNCFHSLKNKILNEDIFYQINNYINTVVDENSDIASKYLAGLSVEKRQLQVLVLKSPTSSRAIWIGGLIKLHKFPYYLFSFNA